MPTTEVKTAKVQIFMAKKACYKQARKDDNDLGCGVTGRPKALHR
jgi:hypothetical protein